MPRTAPAPSTRPPLSASGHPPLAQVKAGIALCHLDRPDEAAQLLSCLLGEPVDQFADLYADAGSILQGVGRPEAALPYFRCLPPPPPSVAPAPGPAELTCAVGCADHVVCLPSSCT